MARSRLLRLLAPFLLLAACGGGRSGTGISESVEELVTGQPAVSEAADVTAEAVESVVSTIQGNVARLNLAVQRPVSRPTRLASVIRLLAGPSVAHAAPALEGIHVRVEGFDSSVTTDPAGMFVLSGRFSGPSIVRFERAEDGLDARIAVNVPKGGVLSLRDITLDAGHGVAAADFQDLSFDAVIADKDCLRRQLAMASRFAPQGERFVVELEGATITDDSGRQRYCIALRPGDDAHVQGVVRPNGTIGDASMMVDGENRLREAMTMNRNVAGAVPRIGVPQAALPERSSTGPAE